MTITAIDLDTAILYTLIAVVILLIAEVVRQNQRLRRLLLGKTGRDLEEVVVEMSERLHRIEREIEDIERVIENLDRRLRRSVQHVNTMRYNPFPDQGGNQSFATAFINEEGDGVVISSLYSREKVSVYAKPVISRESEYELTDEEKSVIDKTK